jgi:transcription-repair coupling factor (superfamily II helicase)
LLLAESDGRRESLLDFPRLGRQPAGVRLSGRVPGRCHEKVGIATSSLMTGFAWVEEGLDFVTETELFASSPTGRRRRRQEQVSDVEALIKDLSELKVGDPIVHADHGIGRYRGLINMDMGQKNPDGTPALQEFLHLEYAADAVLYVPVSQLHLISRYTGVSPDDAPLHKLGGGHGKSQAQGRRAGARLGRRAAQHLRPPRRAPGPCLPLPSRLRAVRPTSASRKRPTSAPPSTR